MQREGKMLEREMRCERSWRGGVDGGLFRESRKMEEGQGGVNRSSREACCGVQPLWNVECGSE